MRIAGIPQTAVPIQIKPGGKSGVGLSCKVMRVVRIKRRCKGRQGNPIKIIVKICQDNDIGCYGRYNTAGGFNLRIFISVDIAQQQARAIPAKGGCEGSDAVGFGSCLIGNDNKDGQPSPNT